MQSQPAISESLIFGALDSNNRLSLMARGLRHSYQKGEMIFRQGDEGSWLLVIEEGIVEISIMLRSGRKSVLNHMQTGEILGEIALFDRAGRSADAVAVTPVTGTVIHRQHVLDILNNDNKAFHSIIQTLCSRVRNASEMFETQSIPTASSRLARCLMRVAKKWGRQNNDGSVHIEVAFSQSDLGDLAGLARENVNRHLQAWTQSGLIRFDKGDITLLDSESLAELAEL